MPSEEWKIRNFHQKWYAGETISVGIGQGAVTATPIQLARAIAAVTTGGVLVRPHVVAPDQVPAGYRNVSLQDPAAVTRVPIDPQNWITITNAMGMVTAPGGTAGSAHLQGIDFAGKTGTAQVVSNAFKKSQAHSSAYNDNVWFMGVTPRRNPEIVVGVLLEGGLNSALAGRVASQVVKAFVEKQRRIHNNPMLFSDKADPGSVPLAGVWNSVEPGDGDGQQLDADNHAEDVLHGGTFRVKIGKTSKAELKRASRALAVILPGGQ
jgi:penicillin-binding protein 2